MIIRCFFLKKIKINDEGGFFQLQSGLSALSLYKVVKWEPILTYIL